MNRRSRLTSVLLDKSVVREALRALQRLETQQALPERQFLSFAPLHQLLLQSHTFPLGQAFLPHLRLLTPGKYCRRWAQRLREEGFSPEDALMVSHASFGVDVASETFGAEVVLTTDYALKTRFEQQLPALSMRFERMTHQHVLPYRDAALPTVLRPEELLELLQD